MDKPRWPTTQGPEDGPGFAANLVFIGYAGRLDVWAPNQSGDVTEEVARVFREPSSAEWDLDDVFHSYIGGELTLSQKDGETFPLDLDPTPAEICDICRLLTNHYEVQDVDVED